MTVLIAFFSALMAGEWWARLVATLLGALAALALLWGVYAHIRNGWLEQERARIEAQNKDAADVARKASKDAVDRFDRGGTGGVRDPACRDC